MDVAHQLGVARRGITVAWAQRAVGHVAVAWLSVSLATLPLQGATHRRPGGGSRSRRRGALDARHPKVSCCQARVSARVCKEGAARPQ